MLDYAWRTEETEADFQRVLYTGALKFLQWRAKGTPRNGQPLDKVFRDWWMMHGPLGFRSSDDALRFRDELLIAARAVEEEAMREPT